MSWYDTGNPVWYDTIDMNNTNLNTNINNTSMLLINIFQNIEHDSLISQIEPFQHI